MIVCGILSACAASHLRKEESMSDLKLLSASIRGLTVDLIDVETDVSGGLPGIHMVGNLSGEVREGAERIRCAIRNCGITLPPKKIIVNLSPADLRKTGTGFDLAIALSLLEKLSLCRLPFPESIMICGELSLNGTVRPVNGILPIVCASKEAGIRHFLLPRSNCAEAVLIDGVHVYPADDLSDLIDQFQTGHLPDEFSADEDQMPGPAEIPSPDFSEINGQGTAKRAAAIAVSGHHNLLMIGPPGSGKTMIARAIPSILPPLSKEEQLDVTKIYSVAGLLDDSRPYLTSRPFRDVHHTATKASMIGGGLFPKPGEISLAHGGVLFLDELGEFQKNVLEALREPVENRKIRLTRGSKTYEYPADFFLVAAMNPCPCGNYPDRNRCHCTEAQLRAYSNKLSQPFLDRMDLCITMSKVSFDSLKNPGSAASSEKIREKVIRAWEIQRERFEGTAILSNAHIPAGMLDKYCDVESDEKKLLGQAYDRLNLTARTYHKVLRIARTIADLEGREAISMADLSEALTYRSIDRHFWDEPQ